MISAYTIVVTLHVLIAVFGMGQIAAIRFIAAGEGTAPVAASRKLIRGVSGSLAGMLLTGIGAEWIIHFADEPRLWFRGSFFLVILVGAVLGYASGTARKATDAAAALSRIRLAGGIATALTACVVVLMVLKP